ncbi:hypothetical protein SAMN04487949_0746 [Halogranum gelatinilyticum]|uniref:Uncharacterized protein n=1 Tax=Halogranum gelatinilyticum TaxID=660521 RepID=A0A1G9Q925_9EURY|nr:hypothetical protein [Halogranum gelatinilyticum]SDM07568.1 hypothetical protein SAMN04487949_0746 [Halogranum gelatinilyticum]
MSARAQANLPVLAVALVLLTTVTAVSVALADGALIGADRDPIDRRAASAVADRLVAADSAATERANVLNATAVERLDAGRLDELAPAARNGSVRVRLGDRTLVERGEPAAGVTVRRVVLVAEREATTRSLDLAESTTLTLPRRTSEVTVDVDSANGTTVETVRANDRVVLHDDEGVGQAGDGESTVEVSRFETTRLAFTTTPNPQGTATVTFYPTETTKAVLEVTVDA